MWVALGGAVLSVAAGIGISLRPELHPGEASGVQPDRPAFGELHRNRAGGYEFRHPKGWTVRDAGTATTLSAPRHRAVVTFGLAARGDLQRGERQLVGTIREAYRRVRLTAIQAEPIGGRTAITIAGTGENQRGVPIRFLAATVGGPDRNHSITLFTAAGSDPEGLMPNFWRILESFRVTG